jgi:hypothetical protein
VSEERAIKPKIYARAVIAEAQSLGYIEVALRLFGPTLGRTNAENFLKVIGR